VASNPRKRHANTRDPKNGPERQRHAMQNGNLAKELSDIMSTTLGEVEDCLEKALDQMEKGELDYWETVYVIDKVNRAREHAFKLRSELIVLLDNLIDLSLKRV
jgi:hypothetical protein